VANSGQGAATGEGEEGGAGGGTGAASARSDFFRIASRYGLSVTIGLDRLKFVGKF
jgi:hypothetical protein